jgi:septal ring factor EnvC (AmiA/AmiB activator)
MAQTEPTPVSYLATGMVVTVLISLTSAVGTWVNIVRGGRPQQTQISNQPVEVKAAPHLVTHEQFEAHARVDQHEFDEVKAAIAGVHSKMGGMERGLRAEIKTDVTALHEKVNKVDREIGAIAEAVKLQGQQIASMNTTLLNVLNRHASSSLP